MNILYVCTGNICRSSYLELQSRALAPGLTFSSAGTAALAGSPVDAQMAHELGLRGIESAGFAAQQLTGQHVETSDLILTAEGHHRAEILELHPAVVAKTFTVGQFARSLERIDIPLRGPAVLEAVGRIRLAERPADDVADPYRRGPGPAAACAARLDALLETILPRLATE